jgi:hypothetical protein
LGANTDSIAPGFVQSTAVGSGAQITGNNQIVLGTASENVIIPGNFSAGNMSMFRNRIINGSMRFAQRGTSATGITATSYNTCDRWQLYTTGSDGTYKSEQIALTSTDLPYQNGLFYSHKITATTASTGLGAFIITGLEGFYCQDLGWGTSNGSYMTLSFWFRSNNPTNSVFCNTLKANSPGNTIAYTYSTQFTYTVASGGWQKVVQVIPPPPAGFTLQSGTTCSIAMEFFVYWDKSGTNGAWVAGNTNSAPGTTAWSATANNYVEFTGVQFEKGTIATPFELLPYDTELRLCQRYFYAWNSLPNYTQRCFLATWYASSTTVSFLLPFPVPMRAIPGFGTNFTTNNIVTNTAGANVTISASTTFTINGSDTSTICAGVQFSATANNPNAFPIPLFINTSNTIGSQYLWFNAEF